jgi:hypothetical protein
LQLHAQLLEAETGVRVSEALDKIRSMGFASATELIDLDDPIEA